MVLHGFPCHGLLDCEGPSPGLGMPSWRSRRSARNASCNTRPRLDVWPSQSFQSLRSNIVTYSIVGLPSAMRSWESQLAAPLIAIGYPNSSGAVPLLSVGAGVAGNDNHELSSGLPASSHSPSDTARTNEVVRIRHLVGIRYGVPACAPASAGHRLGYSSCMATTPVVLSP